MSASMTGKMNRDSCYSCCCNDDSDFTILPPSTEFDKHAALQDLRSIHGLSHGALVKFDFTFGDVVQWTFDDQQNLSQLRGTTDPFCSNRRDFQRVPLIENAAISTVPISSILPGQKCWQYAIGIVYFVCFLVHGMFLFSMHTEGWHPPVFRVPFSKTVFGEVEARFRQGPLPFDEPPKLDWSSFDYNFHRFDVFFALSNIPMFLIFGVLMSICKGMMQRLTKTLMGGICEHVRRSVNMSSRESMDSSFHDFLRRIEFFFYTNPNLKSNGKRSIHHSLHRALDELNNTDLRFDQTWVRNASYSAIRPILTESISINQTLSTFLFYSIPIAISFIVYFGTSAYLLHQTIYNAWRTPQINVTDLNLLQTSQFFENQGFQWIIAIISFDVLCFIWILVITADDFAAIILYNSGLFERASCAAIEHANFLIGRVWDITVVQGVLPYVEAHKAPDLQLGDLHHQLILTLNKMGLGSQEDASTSAPKFTNLQNSTDNNRQGLGHITDTPFGPQWDPLRQCNSSLELLSDSTDMYKGWKERSRSEPAILSHNVMSQNGMADSGMPHSVIELQKRVAKDAAEAAVKLVGQRSLQLGRSVQY